MNTSKEQSQWETVESTGPRKRSANLGKLSIIAALIGIMLKFVGDVFFEEQSSLIVSINITAALIAGTGIIVGMGGLRRAWSCLSIDMLLLAGAGLFLNCGLFAMGIVKLPIPGQFGMGPGNVSAREINVTPVAANSGRSMVTKDWTTGYPVELTDKNFDDVINNSDMPVLVDFWAPWCGPCRRMGPVIERLAAKYEGKVKVCKLNVDIAKDTAANFKIRGIPAIILFKNGLVQQKWTGLMSERELSSAIDKKL